MTHLPLQLLLFLAITWQRISAWCTAFLLSFLVPLAAPFRAVWDRATPWRRRAMATVFTGESTSAEWTSAGFSAVLAVVLCLSTTTFDLSPVYDQLRWMDEQGWGILFAIHASLTLTAWCTNHERGRRIGLLCSTAIWFTWLAMLVKGTPQTTGWVYLVPATATAVGYMRLSQAMAQARQRGQAPGP